MNVLVDSTSWSAVLRRKQPDEAVWSVLNSLIRDDRVAIIGPIRQEVLSGIRDHVQFERLRERLRGYTDTAITSVDYVEAAGFYNECQRHGIQGSHTDFLICAVAVRNGFAIFTMDQDFPRYAKYLPITLYDS